MCGFHTEQAPEMAELYLRLTQSPWAISKAFRREDDGHVSPCPVSREDEPGESPPSRPWEHCPIALVDHADVTPADARPRRGDGGYGDRRSILP